MDFLQPAILYALPLIGLPLLIHLINQRRHRTVHWAATMFLLQARRMARGMARLRYWLIMLARMLAVAGLIFTIARPMAAGWLGLTAGGAPELTVILLDRSASMEQSDPATGLSRRESSLQRLADLIERFETDTRLLLIDSATLQSQEIVRASQLLTLPDTEATHTAADIPELIQAAADYVVANEAGRTDIWLCTDLQRSNWNPSDGRWNALRTQLLSRNGVRLNILNSSAPSPENLSVQVTGVHRRESDSGAELVMDLRVAREGGGEAPVRIPLTMTIDGASSVLELELVDRELVRNGHAIPIPRDRRGGWGTISLPHDSNVVDNEFHFVYAEPAIHKTTIVAEDPQVERALKIAAESPAERDLSYVVETIPPSDNAILPLDDSGLLLWQAPLPDEETAAVIRRFIDNGRSAIFFPPKIPTERSFAEAMWRDWQEPDDREAFPVARWKTDGDLWSNAQSGNPLPIGQLKIRRACELTHPSPLTLAALQEGPALLSRVSSDHGGVWFCGTLPESGSSSFVPNGVALYVMVQRALSAGAAALSLASARSCGEFTAEETRTWKSANAASAVIPPSQRSLQGGVYQDGDRWIALNRPESEDRSERLTEQELPALLGELNYVVIDNTTGDTDSLANEIWRTFLFLMIAALIVEALLCLPAKAGMQKGDERTRFMQAMHS